MANWKPFEKSQLDILKMKKIVSIYLGNGLNFWAAISLNQMLFFPTPFLFLQLYSESMLHKAPSGTNDAIAPFCWAVISPNYHLYWVLLHSDINVATYIL